MIALTKKIEMQTRLTMHQAHEDCDWLGTIKAIHSIG